MLGDLLRYRLVEITHQWDRRGNPINVQEEVLGSCDSLKITFEMMDNYARVAGADAAWRPNVRKFEVRDEDGTRLFLEHLYQQVVGPLTFAALCAIPFEANWSIDLQEWSRNGAQR